MKMAVVFEVPDDQGDTYAAVAARMVQHHQFSTERRIKHWSFDTEMRPIAVIMADDTDPGLADAVAMARREVDQQHPWIPGGVFKRSDHLKLILTGFLDALLKR